MSENIKSNREDLNYPVLDEIKLNNSNGYTDCFYKLKNGSPADFSKDIPYVQDVDHFMEQEDISHNRIIIVSDEKKFALKAAVLLTARGASGYDKTNPIIGGSWVSYDEEEDDEDYYDEEEYLDEDGFESFRSEEGSSSQSAGDQMLRVLDLSGVIPCEEGNTMQNQYNQRLSAYPMIVTRDLLVTGLENPVDREKKLESVLMSFGISNGPAISRLMILIPRSEKDALWVKNLMRTQDFSMLWLEDCGEYLRNYADSIDKTPYLNIPDFVLNPHIPTTQEILNSMITDLGPDHAEEDYLWYLSHPNPTGLGLLSARDKLKLMVGLEDAKNAALEFGALAIERAVNTKLKGVRQHMLFFGDPGTGKTTVGELMAEILSETGNSKAVFVTAGRSDLIGRYVGQTAPKVAERFREARGGILFVDEAGFFLSDDTEKGYTAEAIREFVRYMELYDDVTVIFALYKNEVADFLALDDGLKSRIGRLVEFKNYTNEELIEIANHIAFTQGYDIDGDAEEIIVSYLDELREKSGISFGNARDVRKLVESSIIMHAVRLNSSRSLMESREAACEEAEGILSTEDVRNGIERLKKADISFFK